MAHQQQVEIPMEKMDKYSRAFSDAMDRTNMRNKTVATYLGGTIQVNNISHWRTGRRGIPKEYALALGTLLNIAPEKISKAYDQEHRAQTALNAMAAHGARTGIASEGYVAIEHIENFSPFDNVSRVVLPELLVRRELGMTPIEHVRWTILQTRTMEPEIKRHALLLVDTTINQPEHVLDGGIYAYLLWGRPDIRRISIRRGMWSLQGGMPEAERVELGEADRADLEIVGAVVGWL